MTLFEYIKNEATIEQIANIFFEIENDAFNECLHNTDDIAKNITHVCDKNFIIDSDYVDVLNWDIDEINKISREIKELYNYIDLIKEALKNENDDKIYELVNMIIHKYKEYITIYDCGFEKKIYVNYEKYGIREYTPFIMVNSKVYEEMIANDNKKNKIIFYT